MATQELVVPRSIPITLLIVFDPFYFTRRLPEAETRFGIPAPIQLR